MVVVAAASPLLALETASARSEVVGEIVDAGPDHAAPPVPASSPAKQTQGEFEDGLTPLPGLPPPPAPPESQPDVAESIVSESADGGETRVAAGIGHVQKKAESAPNRTDVAGWARESSEWTLASSGYRQGAPSPLDVPHDRFISRTQMFMRVSHVRGRWFEATVSGVLGYAFREQGPSGTDAFNSINGQATASDSQVELRELYIGLFSRYIDFRIGQQRLAWGRTDTQSSNDVLNARDIRDPILTEPELRHVPTPLIRADFDFGAVSLELVGTPVFVPDVYDVYGTNWAAIQQDAPAQVRGLFGSLSSLFDPTKQTQFNALLHETQLPAANWTAPSGGTKVSAAAGGVDLDFYYHYGFDSTPYVSLTPSPLSLILAPNQPFTATYVRRHHVGFDAATTAGPIALRLDAAYESERVYYHAADLSSLSSPSFLAVASIEYQTGNIDEVILVEAIYNRLIDTVNQPLIGYDQDSFGVAGTLRWPLGTGWAIDLHVLAGVEPVSLAMQSALRWKVSDAVILKAGAVLLAGEENSVGWYYRHNTAVFLQAKYSF